MASAELIERREFKYLIDERTAARVRDAIRPFCDRDPHAAKHPSGRYLIDSCYFDDAAFSLYRANLISLVDRYKVRVRTYPPYKGGPVFFEVKSRYNEVISKTRGLVPGDLWESLVSDPSARIPEKWDGARRVAVEKLMALVQINHLRPVTLVRYEREPFVSQIDDYARVTFDRSIRSKALNRASFDTGDRGWRWMDNAVMQRMGEALTVLELKFTSAVPCWMSNVVRNFELHRLSFSKYGTSVKTWHNHPLRRIPAMHRFRP